LPVAVGIQRPGGAEPRREVRGAEAGVPGSSGGERDDDEIDLGHVSSYANAAQYPVHSESAYTSPNVPARSGLVDRGVARLRARVDSDPPLPSPSWMSSV